MPGETIIKFLKYTILFFFCTSFPASNIYPCIMIAAENDTVVLAGNNEDYSDPNTYVWFVKNNENRKYGCIYFGYSNFRPQGGMNEAGLCFDHFATASNPVYYSFNPPLIFTCNPWNLVMSSCSTVTEVVSIIQHDLSFMKNYSQILLFTYPDLKHFLWR